MRGCVRRYDREKKTGQNKQGNKLGNREEERKMQTDEKLCIIVVFLASSETNCPKGQKDRRENNRVFPGFASSPCFTRLKT